MIYRIYDCDERMSAEIGELIEEAAYVCLEQELADIYNRELPIELSISVVDRDEILEINRGFRGVDSITDVLSFPQYGDAETLAEDIALLEDGQSILLGDVVICYDVALEQAAEFGTGEKREVVYLFVHSVLHLLGYDHMTEDDRREMREMEERVLNAIGLPQRS